MRRAIAAVGLLLLTACAGEVQEARTPVTQPGSTAPAQRVDAESCPKVSGAGNSSAAIDYVDFIHALGHNYVADFAGHVIHASRADLGQVALRSRCSFSALNDRTHKNPGDPRDGDTAFLAPGTPIYALKGWPTECRLATDVDGRVHVYLAMDDQSATAKARDCALRR